MPWQSPEWLISSVPLASYKYNTLGMPLIHGHICINMAPCNYLPHVANLFMLAYMGMHYAVSSANGLEWM